MRLMPTLTIAFATLVISHAGAQTVTQELALLKREAAYLDSKISAYAVQNPVRTAAVVMTFGGIYKGLNGYLSDNEALATTVATVYCIAHFNDCAEAATYLAPLLRNRAEYQSRINQLTSAAPSPSASSRPSLNWASGTPHPAIANVVRGDTSDSWQPAAGFRWLRPDDPADLSVIEKTITGVGIQCEINTEYARPQVLRILHGSPAERAGMPRGIIVTKVDGIPTQGKTLKLFVDLLRGENGSTVVLEYWNPVDQQTYTVHITRRPFNT